MENKKNGTLAIVAFICLFIALIPHFLTFCIIACVIFVLPFVCIHTFFESEDWRVWVFMGIPFTALMIFGILVTINNVMEIFQKK